jgi:hypothetical protein
MYDEERDSFEEWQVRTLILHILKYYEALLWLQFIVILTLTIVAVGVLMICIDLFL